MLPPRAEAACCCCYRLLTRRMARRESPFVTCRAVPAAGEGLVGGQGLGGRRAFGLAVALIQEGPALSATEQTLDKGHEPARARQGLVVPARVLHRVARLRAVPTV